MKKAIIILLAFVMMLSLVACGKSAEAEQVESMISSIGEISLDSGNAIEEANKAYSLLSEKSQKQVENYSILVSATETYNKLLLEEEARQAELAIQQAIITEYLDKIQAAANRWDLKEVYSLCQELVELNPDQETLHMANDYIETIPIMCFAGTFILQPEYYIEVEIDDKKTEDSCLSGSWLLNDEEYVSCHYYFKNEIKAKTAMEQYKEYISNNFNYLGIDGNWYDFADNAGNEFAIRYEKGRYEFGILFDKALIDFDKIDFNILGDNPTYSKEYSGLTIRDSGKVLKR